MDILSLLTAIFLSSLLLLQVQTQKYLSKDGTPSQSSTFYWVSGPLSAVLAIKGGPTNDFNSRSCATTKVRQTFAWWMLRFSQPIYFTNIKISYRSYYAKRLAGYYLYITNTSVTNSAPKPRVDDLCYHHEGPGLPSINQNVNCSALGRYLVIYNDRLNSNKKSIYSKNPFLELCDVRVLGCPQTKYGPDCLFNCSLKCFHQHCYPGNGSCVWGCNCLRDTCDNATVTVCTEGCKRGFGGQYCNENNLAAYGTPTLSPQTDTVNASLAIDGDRTAGSCFRVGSSITSLQLDLNTMSVIRKIYIYISDAFTESNIPLLYVSNTSGISGVDSRLNFTSDFSQINPVLTFTANTFITGRYVVFHPGSSNVDFCEVEAIGCVSGFYGGDCNNTCPEHCSGPCHPETGVCVYGCMAGWINQYCNQSCPEGTFGRQCLDNCHCYNSSSACNNIDGLCPPGGCDRGFEESSCSIECLNGTYGFNCNETCDGCLYENCNKQNGSCTDQSGCKPGWKQNLPFCKEVCDDGYFGTCSVQCHCRSGMCDKATGYCSRSQCARGWMGKTCSQECEIGHYGFDCADICNTCINTSCDSIEGNCTEGCIPGYTGVQCQMSLVEHAEQESSIMYPALAGIIAAVCIVLIVMVLVFLFRKNHRNQKTKDGLHHEVSDQTRHKLVNYDSATALDNIPLTSKTSENGTENKNMKEKLTLQFVNPVLAIEEDTEGLYNNVELQKYNIAVSEMNAVITKMKEEDLFDKQFQILPKGLVQAHKEAAKPENKIKNRYAETWPYDHSRVVLKGPNDYINASYIDSYFRNKAYIATQGPKKGTINDFWQMIWQENVEVIVMITQLEEGHKKKCEQYWPKSKVDVKSVGKYDITLTEEKSQTVNVYRKIELSDKKTKALRIIHHYHFTEWPDHGVPDKIKLVSFYRKVKKTKTSLKGPMVVHCSAGIGRTGTFIAIDALFEKGSETGHVDVMEYVQIMRKDRLNMIQTKEQYTAVFEALSEAFSVPDFAVETNEFLQCLQDQTNIPAKDKKINKQYQKLQELKPVYQPSCFRAANLKENINKNAVKDILPHDSYRPYLMSHDKSRTDYINAVTIPEYKSTTKLLITHYPLKETVVDFWTMVYDHDCTAVVLLESCEETNMWPDRDDSLEFNHFNITQNSSKSSNSLQININFHDNAKTVKVLVMDDWKTNCIPASSTQLLEEIKHLANWRGQHPGSAAIVCRDGCRRSGMFVTIQLALQKLEMDEEIDIFHVVRTMQIRRPEFISDFDQYKYCYQCIVEHLTTDSIYANV